MNNPETFVIVNKYGKKLDEFGEFTNEKDAYLVLRKAVESFPGDRLKVKRI